MATDNNQANRFDNEAQGWDEKPLAKEISSKSSASILSHINFTSDMEVMDFGCGTGLISESILPKVKSVLGIDAAQGMVFLTHENQLGGKKFDVIYSSFAMHHVEDVPRMFQLLASYLKPGGHLAIVDLEKTENTPLFHAKIKHNDVFHHGFTTEELVRDAEKYCDEWENVKVFPSFSITKDLDDLPGQSMTFGALILICNKK